MIPSKYNNDILIITMLCLVICYIWWCGEAMGVCLDCKVTAYNACAAQCDDTPTITASNKTIRKGYCALSRDIEKKYGLNFGDKIVISGMVAHGYPVIYEFQDRMNRRIRNTVDVYMVEHSEAINFGRKKMSIYFSPMDKK